MARFVHFMPVDSALFNGEFIRLIGQLGEPGEHLFLIGAEKCYEEFAEKGYDNIRYQPDQRAAAIRRYARQADAVFLHSLALRPSEICRLGRRCAAKIVWCVWGHDLYAVRPAKSPLAKLKKWLAARTVGRFRAIAAGFKYDEAEIRRRYGDAVPVYNAPYATGYYREDIDRIAAGHARTDQRLNILVGHSAYPFLQHEKYLERLAAYKDEPIVVTLILSYGEAEYADRVARRALEIFGAEKVRIIREFLSWEAYIELLCDVDIAIFDYEHQAALGNLVLLAYLDKKLYLSPTGIVGRAFRTEEIETRDCNEIGTQPLGTLGGGRHSADRKFVENLLDKQQLQNQWKRLFRDLR